MHPEVRRSIDQLDYAIAKYLKPETSIDDETLSSVAKLLCVRCCGALEQGVRTILVTYAWNVSGDKFTRAISRLCQDFQNPKPQKIVEFFERIDLDFKRHLESEWTEEEKSAIGTLVAHRIKICHGQDSDIILGRVSTYFKQCRKFLHRLDEYFLD